MDDVKVNNIPYSVVPVTEYDPFEAKFAASLYWLVFRATEDGEFDNIPSQVTSPIQRDSEKRITVRPEVTEFLTNGEIYCRVCNSIFHGKVPVVGQWALIQTLSRHGFYVVEEGDIAVTDSALQQKKPFRKSTHLALMDCLMNAFSAQVVTVQQVVQCVSKFSSFSASKELPFDLEDALLLWINKICATLNENQLQKQKHHAEQLLQNQDKAKRFRFRRDQLQPKVQTAFPMMEELLKDISDGKCLLGIIMFYHATVINLEDVRFDKNLSTEDCVYNLDLFRSLCSQFICTSVLALKIEDLLYGSQAMKPNVIALLAEIFQKCEMESLTSENGVIEKHTSKSDFDLRYIAANKENVMDNKSSSAPVLNLDKLSKFIEHGSPRESFKGKSERSSSMSGQLSSSASDPAKQENGTAWKSQSDGHMNSNSRLSFKSPFHLDFTVDNDVQQPLNGPLPKQGTEKEKEKENPFSGILQRPVLAGDPRKHSLPANKAGIHGSPRTTPRQDVPLLMRRNKQKQRTLDLEDWDMQQEEVEELHLNDLQRSQSLTGLDKAKVEPRQSFHAWREDTGASLSDTNLASSRNDRISLDFRPNPTSSVPQRGTEGGTQGTHVPMTSSGLKAKREEHASQDSLSSSPKSTDSLNMRPSGDRPREIQHSVQSGVLDSCASDISTKELNQFEEIEAMILAGKSVETPRRFVKPSKLPNAPSSQDEEDDLNTSVSSEDMNKFRLEVLQRLTEDKLREIPDEAEMEDDDDPIMRARNNAVSSPRNPPEQRTRLEVSEPPVDVPTDQLSPITEGTEPCPSVASNPNSASSPNSTTPSSPCSPLDVAPFMPAFFTTSPANTLDRKKQRMSLKDREDTETTLVAEEEDDFPSNPEYSATPRLQHNKGCDFPSKRKSFEQLTRGSYTVGQVSVESAQAAGIPVINASLEEIRPRADSASSQSVYSEPGDVFHSRKLSEKETNSIRDLSGFRPLVLSSAGGETNECYPAEGVDGRRDSLEGSPAHSPSLTRGKRDDTRQEVPFRSRDLTAQDSPGDVVIFERSLSNSHGAKEDNADDDFNTQASEHAQRNSASVTRSKTSEAYVFDFNQDAVQHYENHPVAHDFRTYKKGKPQGRLADESNSPQGNQRFQGSQQDGHFATFDKNYHSASQEHRPPSQQRASAVKEFVPSDKTLTRHDFEENPNASTNIRDLRESDGFSTFRKDTAPVKNDVTKEAESVSKGFDLRQSDGFSTFRKEPEAASSGDVLVQYQTVAAHGQREYEADQYATFAKSTKKHDSSQHYAREEMHHPPELEPSAIVATRPLPSQGGEGEIHTTPRGGHEEQIRVSGSSNITRSRTFRKRPDGQIIEGDDIGTSNSTPRQDDENSPTNSASRLAGQQTANTHIRASPEGDGNDNPHRISWTDESEAGARLSRQLNASVDRPQTTQESHDVSSPRRRGSPRQTGRGSPGARISWLTAAKSGVGGQVMLNDKGCMQGETGTDPFADELSINEGPRFIATAVFRPKRLPYDEAAPWKGHENGAKVPQEFGLRAVSRVDPSSLTNVQAPVNGSESLTNVADTNCSLDDESKSSKERFQTEGNILSSVATSESEPDTRAGGSIRDRIAALSAAAGVSRLNVTQGSEQSKITSIKAVTQSSENETRRRAKADLFEEASESSENPANTESQQELSQISAKNGVAFDVGFQSAPKNRPLPRVLSRLRTSNLERKDESAVGEPQVVRNTEIGVAKDTSVAFEVNFDDEPCSKRARDEPVLLQSPFKALKARSNLRRQQKFKPSQPQGAQPFLSSKVGERGFLSSSRRDDSKPSSNVLTKDDKSLDRSENVKTVQKQYEISFTANERSTEKTSELLVDTTSDNVKSKVPQLLKRNTFTLETESDKGLPIVKVLNELASKEESKQEAGLPSSEQVPKRSTFTLDSVSQSIESASSEGLPVANVLNDLANKEESKQSKLQSDVDTSSVPNENSQKRSTFTLESVSQEIDDAIRRDVVVVDALQDVTKSDKEKSLRNKTVAVDTSATSVKEDISLEIKHEPSEKRSTYTLDAVSSSLQSGTEEGLPVTEVLYQLAKREELKSSPVSGTEDSLTQIESVSKRGTFTLDTVSQSLDEAESRGLPTVDILDQLASKHESNLPVNTPSDDNANSKPSTNRGTYTLDTVSHAIEEAVEKGIPVSETLNHLAQEATPLRHTSAHGYNDSSTGELAHGLATHLDARALSPDHRDEIEASFEDALEQLEDCLTFVSFPSASDHDRRYANRKRSSIDRERSSPDRQRSSSDREQSSSDQEQSSSDREQSSSDRKGTTSETLEKRGTYNLDDVASSVEDGVKDGVPVVETLGSLSKAKTRPKDGYEKAQLSEQRRGTYTLDEVSLSLRTASEQGIPVVEALKNMTRDKEPVKGTGKSAQKRGTYTLDDVSKSLEHAKKTGIPVIEALESLSKEKPASPLRLKIPERSPENRGTYTLDEVSNSLEKAKQKGLPVVDALGQMTASKDVSFRQTPDAVHRRQEKLVNRKTYALASPLETIGEGTKLRLYDGSQRQMMSPLTLHMKTKEIPAPKANSNENKGRGLGVVQKLDFLTSACELLLEANAKEMAKDRQETVTLPENTRSIPTTDESVRRSHEVQPEHVNESVEDVKSCTDGGQTDRSTYSLDSVSKTIDDAKAAGIPVVDALQTVTASDTKDGMSRKSNLKRLNSKSDSELMNEGNAKQSSDRYTHSLEDMSRTLEDAQKAGIPVIQALDELTNELAEFSRSALGEEVQIVPLDKDNRKRKRHSETPIRSRKPRREQSPNPSSHASPYPPPIRKAYSLNDVAFAVQQAFQSGTSLSDFLDSIASEKPAEPVSSSRDIRPRSVDSGFLSSLSDYDISSHSFESPRNRSNTYILDSSNEELDIAKILGSQVKEDTVHAANTTHSSMVDQTENRRTFTLDHVSGSVERDLSRGIPVIEALEKLSLDSFGHKTDHANDIECKENAKNVSTEITDKTLVKTSSPRKKQSPPKPKRQITKKSNSQQSNSDEFVIEFFSSDGPQQPNTSKFQIVNDAVEEINFNNSETNAVNPEKGIKSAENEIKFDETSPLAPTIDPDSVELKSDSNSAPPRGRATWRPSGSVLDKIASLMDAAEDCGMSPSDVLNQVTDLPCDAEGEIEETPDDQVEDEKVVTSQITYLRMQLEEKRRHIEAQKHRAQADWEDQRRRLGQTAFWYVIGKAQGGQNVGEGTGSEVLYSDKPHLHDKPRNPVTEFPNQPSPPIAWSSPANSPLPASVSKPSPSGEPQFETREFRLSDYPPGDDLGTNQDAARPSSQPAVEVGSRPTPVPPRPSSHDPAASRYTAPARKCWDVDVAQVPTPPPLVHPDTASVSTDTKQENPPGGGAKEIEVETNTSNKKGLAMFIGDDANPTTQGLTPEQERKREKFMRLRQKKQEEDRTRKEAELEKKRRREEKQREKEMLHKMEEERLRREELERQKAEQELRMREAQAAARVPDSYTTYRRPGPRPHVYDADDDANSHIVPAPAQPSGFAEFSGPQCYVKPSGKSNRKIIVNAISHVCLSGTVNQDQKEKCLQAISESDGHHFMILFKDGVKFRGIYVHNLDNDQLFKIFGIGPRVITSKMIEGIYKYNSGGKEFTKIPSKTLSIAVDGFAIQKSYWHTGKHVVQSKTSSNLKRPPRPPQR